MAVFVVFLIVGIIILGSSFYKVKKCTNVTYGVVADVEYKVQKEDDREKTVYNINTEDYEKNNIKFSACPIYEYTVDGNTYVKKSSIYYSSLFLKKGKEVKIHYNPENPEQYYTFVELANFAVGIIALVIGIMGLLSCLIELLIS